jgi:hypothetical protein
VAARHFGGVAIPSAPMAVPTGVGIVGFLVAFDALCGRREVDWAFLSGELNAAVTLEAVDALDDVSAVLERVIFLLLLEAQHLGARACKAGEEDQSCDGKRPRHFFPSQVRW